MTEIQAQLRLLCRRANRIAAQQAFLLFFSWLVLVIAGLLVAGMHLPAEAFRLLTWLALASVIAVALVASVVLMRRWLDQPTAAAFADTQAQLQERLTTLVSIAPAQAGEGLTPLLAAQVAELSSRWRPEVLLPWRLPRSAYAAAASLLLLLAALWFEQPPPLPATRTSPSPAAGDQQMPQIALLEAQRSKLPQETGEGTEGQARPDSGGKAAAGDDSSGSSADSNDGSAEVDPGSLAALPDRLQQAIRQALSHPEPRRSGADGDDGAEHQPTDGSEPLKGDHAKGKGKEAMAPAAVVVSKSNDPAKPSDRRDPSAANAPDGDRPPPSFDGEPPPASGKTAGENLLGKAEKAGAAGRVPAFKVTLTSFMSSVSGGVPERQARPLIAERAGEDEQRALNDEQRDDDLLHETEIPVEYEGVVRRAYQRRQE